MRQVVICCAVALVGVAAAAARQDQQTQEADVPAALNFTVDSIDGEPVALEQYRGKVVLIVNVASRCGLTPQYEALQAMYERYADQGLVVLGFPCNQFGGQEPKDEAGIKQFCSTEYGVTFPMFAKIDVKGDNQLPLYAYLTGLDTQPTGSGDIQWNFEKFVLDRNGQVIARFEPRTKPDDPALVEVVEKALAEK
jgi:glutathione peroxidase